MAGAIPKGLPDVTDYDDYRVFLRDHYEAKKRVERGYSLGAFAQRAGIASRAHYLNVIARRVNLSREFAGRYAKGLRLSAKETEYFTLLVAANQARTPKEREIHGGAFRYFVYQHSMKAFSALEFERLVRRWPRFLVFCLSRLRGFRPDPTWISRRMEGRLKPAEAREALSYLCAKGYIRVSGGRLRGTLCQGLFRVEGEGDAASVPWARRVLRDAADFSRRRPESTFSIHTILPPREARAMGERLKRAAIEGLPRGRRAKVPGDLYMIVGDVVPLSRGGKTASS